MIKKHLIETRLLVLIMMLGIVTIGYGQEKVKSNTSKKHKSTQTIHSQQPCAVSLNIQETEQLLYSQWLMDNQPQQSLVHAEILDYCPNPALRLLEVYDVVEWQSYVVYDLSANLIKEGKLDTTSNAVNISDLEAGVYMIQFQNPSAESILHRFVTTD